MSGAGLIFDGSFDDENVQRLLADLTRAADNLAPAMKNIGEHLLQTTEEGFREQTGPDGKKWPEVSSRTRARKKHAKVLTESGQLRGSINYRANRKSVTVGTNAPYAAAHQFGFEGQVQVPQHNRLVKQAFGKRLRQPVWATVGPFNFQQNLPARPFLGVGEKDKGEIRSIIEDHIAAALKK